MVDHSHNQSFQNAYEDVLQHLRQKQIRITESRKAVIAYMIATKAHPSADTIYRDLLPKYPSLSLATVYNNLKVLVDEGFVSELKLTNDSTTYYDFMGHQHLNIVCEVCGKITDVMEVDALAVVKEAEKQTGYHITKTQILIYGICPDCQG